MGELVGYARVFTEDQNLNLQIDALLKAGVHPDRIYTDKISGASQKRPGLELAIMDCRDGDTFVVWRIDRLARSMRQLYARLDQIYAKGSNFKSLQENFDFGTVSGKLVLGVLGLVAEFERQIISQRTSAGIKAFRDRKGPRWGKALFMTKERIALVGDHLHGRNGRKKLSGPQIAKKLGVSTASIYAFWKQTAPGKYVRKKPAPPKKKPVERATVTHTR